MGTARNPDFTDDDILLDRVRLVDDILFVNRGKRKFVASTLSPTPEGIDEALAVLARARRDLLRARRGASVTCPVCGSALVPIRSTMVYCSATCRQRCLPDEG